MKTARCEKTTMTRPTWTKSSWRDFPIQQQPDWQDQQMHAGVESYLSTLPPLVTPNEVNQLRSDLAKASEGKAFLLQGGDCAESFAEFSHTNLKSYLQILLQMTVALMYGAGCPVIKVG